MHSLPTDLNGIPHNISHHKIVKSKWLSSICTISARCTTVSQSIKNMPGVKWEYCQSHGNSPDSVSFRWFQSLTVVPSFNASFIFTSMCQTNTVGCFYVFHSTRVNYAWNIVQSTYQKPTPFRVTNRKSILFLSHAFPHKTMIVLVILTTLPAVCNCIFLDFGFLEGSTK